jgi:hypothetical protein
MNARAQAMWTKTALHVWPERYVLASLRLEALAGAAALAAHPSRAFAALVVERDEVSLTVRKDLWDEASLEATAVAGPFRAITFDVNIDLDVCGYLAPAAERLATAGIAIVPQCAFLKDHLLVHERDLAAAVAALEALIAESRASA